MMLPVEFIVLILAGCVAYAHYLDTRENEQ